MISANPPSVPAHLGPFVGNLSLFYSVRYSVIEGAVLPWFTFGCSSEPGQLFSCRQALPTASWASINHECFRGLLDVGSADIAEKNSNHGDEDDDPRDEAKGFFVGRCSHIPASFPGRGSNSGAKTN